MGGTIGGGGGGAGAGEGGKGGGGEREEEEEEEDTSSAATTNSRPTGGSQQPLVVRIMKKALKSEIRAKPENAEVLQKELKLLPTPKSAAESLSSPQWQEWLAAINM